jgi:nucleoside-diphosphate-sugar epimerase
MASRAKLRTIVIVGGSGFIGSALAEQLSKSSHVRILDKNQPRRRGDFEFAECDVRDYQSVQKGLEGADLVIHAAVIQIPLVNEQRRLGYEVNVVGTQNVCESVSRSRAAKGMLLVGSWHTIGERRITGVVNEAFGFRPDMVEERARLYALSKIAQEAVVRHFDEDSEDKIYGIIRIGTALGENMSEKTGASIFISQALKGEPLTPYEHSMYRPMLYVDVHDVCRAFESYATKILNGGVGNMHNSLAHIVNVYYPEPTTVLEMAELVKHAVIEHSNGNLRPEVRVVKDGKPSHFTSQDKASITVDPTKARDFLGIDKFTSPRESIDRIVNEKMKAAQAH